MGTTMEATPTPSPTVTRPKMSTGMVGAKAMRKLPTAKNMSEAIMTGRLPNLSEIGPAMTAPRTAPIKVIDTMSSLSFVEICGQSSLK